MARIRFSVKSAPLSLDATKERDYPNASLPLLYAYVQSDRRWNGHDEAFQPPDITDPVTGDVTTPNPTTIRVVHTDIQALNAYAAWATQKLVDDANAHNRALIKKTKDAEAETAATAATVAAPEVTPA